MFSEKRISLLSGEIVADGLADGLAYGLVGEGRRLVGEGRRLVGDGW